MVLCWSETLLLEAVGPAFVLRERNLMMTHALPGSNGRKYGGPSRFCQIDADPKRGRRGPQRRSSAAARRIGRVARHKVDSAIAAFRLDVAALWRRSLAIPAASEDGVRARPIA